MLGFERFFSSLIDNDYRVDYEEVEREAAQRAIEATRPVGISIGALQRNEDFMNAFIMAVEFREKVGELATGQKKSTRNKIAIENEFLDAMKTESLLMRKMLAVKETTDVFYINYINSSVAELKDVKELLELETKLIKASKAVSNLVDSIPELEGEKKERAVKAHEKVSEKVGMLNDAIKKQVKLLPKSLDMTGCKKLEKKIDKINDWCVATKKSLDEIIKDQAEFAKNYSEATGKLLKTEVSKFEGQQKKLEERIEKLQQELKEEQNKNKGKGIS